MMNQAIIGFGCDYQFEENRTENRSSWSRFLPPSRSGGDDRDPGEYTSQDDPPRGSQPHHVLRRVVDLRRRVGRFAEQASPQ